MDATNPAWSVGLSYDPARTGWRVDWTPEELFAHVQQQYPALAEQFCGATRTGPWQDAPHTQYSASEIVGDQYCLLDRAAWDTDPLFSRGLNNGLEQVAVLAEELIGAFDEGTVNAQRLRYVEQVSRGLAAQQDYTLHAAYAATRSPVLCSAFARVWLLWSMFSTLHLAHLHRTLGAAPAHQAALRRSPESGLWFGAPQSALQLWSEGLRVCEAVAAGRAGPDSAGRALMGTLRDRRSVPPLFGFGRLEERHYVLSRTRQVRTLVWALARAPRDLRTLLFSHLRRKEVALPQASLAAAGRQVAQVRHSADSAV
ncbi:hypothetical protein [Deinococcus multiflagellatus]|uniref:Uncharacterized protein n=1 Tax=Deinococcus multiflagellatus TaxID=1656887 RepID=A0ABW1ZTA7_9DEIO|nr:hypothetical protein [Deinococcus multiflagellatus]MBZ9716130.1 hypothetical protein [Deinococcus multiflagellatus]